MGIEGEKPAPQCPPTPENRALIAGLIRGTMVGLLIPMKILMTKWDEWNLCSWEWLIDIEWNHPEVKKSWQLENKAISPRERIVFQLAFLRGYVSFGEGVCRLYVYECVWCIKREKISVVIFVIMVRC